MMEPNVSNGPFCPPQRESRLTISNIRLATSHKSKAVLYHGPENTA